MPRRAQTSDPSDILGGWADRLVQSSQKPSIWRYRPMPAQDLFHQAYEKYRLLSGGNRSGKTFSTIADDVMVLLKKHPYRESLYRDTEPRRMRFIGIDFDRGIDQIALPLFSQFIPPSALINGSWEDSYQKQKHMLTLADGATCSFMSYEQDPDKFQGVSLHHIHFDEEPPQAIYKESMLRILDTAGTATISETPVQQLEWLQDEIIDPWNEGRLPDWRVILMDTRHNTHLGVEELQKLEAGLTESEIVIRMQGKYDTGSNMVFPEFTRKYPNVIPQSAFNPRHTRDDWRFFRSMDHGLANPTAWGWHAVHRNGSIVTFELLYSAGINVDTWARMVHAKDREIAERFGFEPDWAPEVCVGDPAIAQRNQATGNAATIQQAYALAGINIFTGGIVKTRTGNQNFGLDKMKQYLRQRPLRAGASATTNELGEPWWQITDNCGPLIDELKKARKPKQTLTAKENANVSEEIRDKDNHAIDMAKYFFMATHELRPPEFAGEDSSSAVFHETMFETFQGRAANSTNHREAYDRHLRSRARGARGDYNDFED